MDLSDLADIDIDKCTPAQIAELHEVLSAMKKATLYGKYYSYYPDTGPLRRELYAKHMEFFEAGAKYLERLLMAANRVGKCRLYNDLVPHPDGTVSRIGDLFVRGEPFEVLAWDGQKQVRAQASHVVRKPPELAVELLLASGESFTCSLDHRVLTVSGWQHVRSLLQSVPCLPQSSAAPDPLTHAADDPHWFEIALGLLDHCPPDPAYGGRLLDGLTVVRELRPSQDGAPRHIPALSPSDDLARTHSDSPSLLGRRPSTLGEEARSLVLSAASAAQVAHRFGLHTTDLLQADAPPHAVSALLLRSSLEASQDRSSRQALVSPHMAANHVVAYRLVGVHALYDMTVPEHRNYIADGIIHHNTEAGAFESTGHLTGDYRPWWVGKVFNRPIRMWAAGDTNETTRDVIQKKLLGGVEWHGDKKGVDGTGMIPREMIVQDSISWKAGVPDLIDTVRIDHRCLSGTPDGTSVLGLKSYFQGRRAFQGTEQDLIWCDEEPDEHVYNEMLIRLMTTQGIAMLTFTPLSGRSAVVESFTPKSAGIG